MSDNSKLAGTAASRTLRRAAERLGGVAQLAEALAVPASDLEGWIAGVSRPPHEIFLAALDIVAGAEQVARRAQRFANFSQETADRAQAAANRAQARADRLQAHANRLRRAAGRPAKDDQLRTMSSDEQQPPSNQPGEKVKKEDRS